MTENSPTVQFLLSLKEEEIKETIQNMSPEARSQIIGELCASVGNQVRYFTERAEQIWKEHHGADLGT